MDFNQAQHLRFECLKLAIETARIVPGDALSILRKAKAFEAYVTGSDVAAAERKLSAISAALSGDADA